MKISATINHGMEPACLFNVSQLNSVCVNRDYTSILKIPKQFVDANRVRHFGEGTMNIDQSKAKKHRLLASY